MQRQHPKQLGIRSVHSKERGINPTVSNPVKAALKGRAYEARTDAPRLEDNYQRIV